jgi:1-deoxyxylulose-5-phosphate synthase
MKYLRLDTQSGSLQISRFAFGTGSAMKDLSKAGFFSLFDLFSQAGGNCLDTAPGYNGGRSEAYIGEWLKAHGNRQAMVISSKVCHAASGQPSRLSRRDMEDDLDHSLAAMMLDHVDIVWIHNDDPDWPVEDIIESINAVLKTGKARALGCSNWTTGRMAQANRFARENGLQGFMASQIQWSLARVEGEAYKKRYGALVMDDPSYDWYLQNKMPVFAFSALAQGFFARAAANGLEGVPVEKRAFYETPANLRRLENVKAYMEKQHVPSTVPVLGYLINNKLPCVALMSAKTPEMLKESLLAADADLSAEEVEDLFRG